MESTSIPKTHTKAYKKIPIKIWIMAGVLLLALFYIALFIIPKQIHFAYAGKSCVPQLTLFPSAQKSQSNTVQLEPKGELKIGNWTYATTEMCATPGTNFETGTANVWMSPGGMPFFARQYRVQIGEAPTIKESPLPDGKKLSTSTPLIVSLTAPDQTYQYRMRVDTKSAKCAPKDSTLVCDTPSLELKQGASYEVHIEKKLSSSGAYQKVANYHAETLTPLVFTNGTITPNMVVYDEAKEFRFSFERTISSVKVSLKDAEGASLGTQQHLKENTVTVQPASDLPRKKQYTLVITQAFGADGSSLAEPITIPFSTSGGPKVTSVSIGGEKIAANARIIVSFDQPIAEAIDVRSIARSTGVASVVSRISPTQIAYTLQGGADCSAFNLEIDKGVKSGTNKEASEAVWKHSARTICGTSWVVGSSVKGRSIVAYSFGSGPSTVLFTGGIHGSEPSGSATMQALVNHLQTKAYEIPAGRRVIIVPNANPDGLATGSRYNANGVDLARNFPASNWSPDIQTTSGMKAGGGGASPGSEPETKALIGIVSQYRPRLHISFHAQGSLVGANQVGDSISQANMYAQTVGYRTMYANPEGVMGYAITGEFEDWMGEKLGVPAILIELPSHGGNYINTQLAAIWKMIKA